ncbi:GGDEF domain-containing protein [Aliiglaciecola litoralis]|uniref:diguanylate cyclase n=1 Tax=Aliiglaciecola litoralis TaxID=582857 RepID=A0ABN1LE07_9ALTE
MDTTKVYGLAMSRLFPKPKPALKAEYELHCNANNLKYVMYFSLLACVLFGLHLLHHFRLGLAVFNTEMMPYTLLYGFSIIYPAFNILFLSKLKYLPALTPVATFIEVMFPVFMTCVAIFLSVLGAQVGLGLTPFAVIMIVICFTLQGHLVLLSVIITLAFCVLATLLFINIDIQIASPLIATGLTTSIICIVLANMTEAMRVKQFEALSELNSNNRQLKLLAQQDHLTGLLNRRAVDQILTRELARSERFDHPLCLLMIDIDNFKHINDAYGHVLGDRVLVDVSEAIKLHVRDIDYVGRMGGDEFLVVLVETGHNNGMQIADRMRDEVSKLNREHQDIAVTISIGLGVSEKESHIALIEKADKALYMAKKAGKNKVRSVKVTPVKPADNP